MIGIRKEENGLIYLDKHLLPNIDYTKPPYNFKLIENEKKDCISSDFNDDLTFSIDKYNARKTREQELKELPTLQIRLNELSQDIIQMYCGAVFEDAAERLAEFREKHNRMRQILDKKPREYKI